MPRTNLTIKATTEAQLVGNAHVSHAFIVDLCKGLSDIELNKKYHLSKSTSEGIQTTMRKRLGIDTKHELGTAVYNKRVSLVVELLLLGIVQLSELVEEEQAC